jgi:hypothetical protein
MKRTNIAVRTSTPALGLNLGIAAAALALIAMAAGCSGDGADNSSTAASTTPVASEARGGGSVTAEPAVLAPPVASPAGSRVIALGDSLPPDVNVSVEDSLAAPGEVVAISAVGSDDVSQIGLSDGLGRMQLFTREAGSNAWHILYRVPLKTKRDRVALSVTALNDVNRWRRVWVFIEVRQPSSGDVDPADDDVHQE